MLESVINQNIFDIKKAKQTFRTEDLLIINFLFEG